MLKHTVCLPSYVDTQEAVLFEELMELYQNPMKEVNINANVVEMVLQTLDVESKKIFGDDTTTEICGSEVKGTAIFSSDVDLYINTSSPVTLADRKNFESHLKSIFQNCNVHLGLLAIHMSFMAKDFDILFSNTIDTPPIIKADLSIAENIAVQHTVRAVKIWVKYIHSGKISGYKIESLVQNVQINSPIHNAISNGSMQLFLSLLQDFADSANIKIDRINSFNVKPEILSLLQSRALKTLELFVISRKMHNRFRSIHEINGWINDMHDSDDLDTVFGKIPIWLLSEEGKPRENSPIINGFFHFDQEPHRRDSSEPNVERTKLLLLKDVLDSPLGSYTQKFAESLKMNDNIKSQDELSLLQKYSKEGSEVAYTMLQVRLSWIYGMNELTNGDVYLGLALCSDCLRNATYYVDHFNGWYEIRNEYLLLPKLNEAINNGDCMQIVNALLIRSCMYMTFTRWKEAELDLLKAFELYPNDAYGVINHLALLYGNISNWSKSYQYHEITVALVPKEPTFRYWRAISLFKKHDNNFVSMSNSPLCSQIKKIQEDNQTLEFDELLLLITRKLSDDISANDKQILEVILLNISDFKFFLENANRHHRKIVQAWYEMSLRKLLIGIDIKTIFECEYKNAQKAIRLSIPVFPKTNFDSKLMIDSVMEATGLLIYTCEELRIKGNEFYRRKDYGSALHYYNMAYEEDENSIELLSNMSAVYASMKYYSMAVTYADKAIILDPKWLKGYYRKAYALYMNKEYFQALNTITGPLIELGVTDKSYFDFVKTIEQAIVSLPNTIKIRLSLGVKIDPKKAPAWSLVKYPDQVFIVSRENEGHYCSIVDAILHCLFNVKSNFTILIMPGIYEGSIPINFSKNSELQLLGWDCNESAKYSSKHQPTTQLVLGNDSEKYVLVHASGKIKIILQGLHLLVQEAKVGHCVTVTERAYVDIIQCFLNSSSNPSLTTIDGELHVKSSCFNNSSAIAISESNGIVHMTDCVIKNCFHPAIEARKGGSLIIERCEFYRCKKQAAIIYQNGRQCRIIDCLFSKCGSTQSGAVSIETGSVVIQKCKFINSAVDGIVVQQRPNILSNPEPPPVVIVDECNFSESSNGIRMFFGSGIISKCSFSKHSMQGIFIGTVTKGKKWLIKDNMSTENTVNVVVNGSMLNSNIIWEGNRFNVFVSPFIVPLSTIQ